MILIVLNLGFMDGTVSILIGFFVILYILFYVFKNITLRCGPRGFLMLPKMSMAQTFNSAM